MHFIDYSLSAIHQLISLWIQCFCSSFKTSSEDWRSGLHVGLAFSRIAMVRWASKGFITVVSKVHVPFCISSSYMRVFHSLHTLANTCMPNFYVTHNGGYAVVLYCGFNLHLTNDFKGHFFWAICHPFISDKHLFKYFACFY